MDVGIIKQAKYVLAPQIGPDAFRVVYKFSPPNNDRSRFRSIVENLDGQRFELALEAEWFWEFEALDVLDFGHGRNYSLDGTSIRPLGAFFIRSSTLPAQEKEFAIGYMSKPQKIGDRYLFITKLNPDHWLHCPYDVAEAYFMPGEAGGDPKDYYQRLDVDPGASQKAIQKAFHALAREYHPDVNRSPGAGERFIQVNEAYLTLSDPETRQAYDALFGGDGQVQRRIQRWPGNGAGRLRCMAEERGDTWVVRRVLSFARNMHVRELVIPMPGVRFMTDGVTPVSAFSQAPNIGPADLPFESDPYLNEVKDSLPGTLTYRQVSVQRAQWNWERQEPVLTWEQREAAFDWSTDLIEALQTHLEQHRYQKRLGQAAWEARSIIRERGVTFNLGMTTLAQRYQVDVWDLRDCFWKEGYQRDYAEFLARLSLDNTWGYARNTLVFRFANGVVAFERPMEGAATYIFKLPDGWTIGRLAVAFWGTGKYELRRDEEMKRRLGYLGYTIHRTWEGWCERVQELIYTGGSDEH